MFLKRKFFIIENEYSVDIGRISVIRACVIKRVRPILYGPPCIGPIEPNFILATFKLDVFSHLTSVL